LNSPWVGGSSSGSFVVGVKRNRREGDVNRGRQIPKLTSISDLSKPETYTLLQKKEENVGNRTLLLIDHLRLSKKRTYEVQKNKSEALLVRGATVQTKDGVRAEDRQEYFKLMLWPDRKQGYSRIKRVFF